MPHQINAENKRDFNRMEMDCPASFRINGEEEAYPAQATDLSATGMQLESTEPLGVGSHVLVEVAPEKGAIASMLVKAVVVRCVGHSDSGYRIGLSILEMQPGL